MPVKSLRLKREDELFDFLKDQLLGLTITPKEYSVTLRSPSKKLKGAYFLLEGNSTNAIFPFMTHVANQEKAIDYIEKNAHENGLGKPAFLFYKDGKHFFRFSGSDERKGYRQKYNRSLRNVDPSERNRYILLRPEEIAVKDMREKNLDYFRPKKDDVEAALLSYHFARPVRYTRDPSSRFAQFTPESRDSTLRFMWDSYHPISAPFLVERGRVISLEDPNVDHLESVQKA